MQIYFLDSSALAKRYIAEVGSAWVVSLLDPLSGNAVHAARISGVEVAAAIVRRVRSGSLSPQAGHDALARFRFDFAALQDLVEISPMLVEKAMGHVEGHGLRGYDAVQLAAALAVRDLGAKIGLATTLVSADEDLNRAAVAEGLAVENPNRHP